MNVIGIDAHKRTHTAAVVEEATARALGLGDVTVPANEDGHLQLLRFAGRFGEERVWAIEDCRHVSGALERFLLGAGETVIRVPPNLMAGARKSERARGKSDPIDATAVARAAIPGGSDGTQLEALRHWRPKRAARSRGWYPRLVPGSREDD